MALCICQTQKFIAQRVKLLNANLKESFRGSGTPSKEYRVWQENLAVLQMYKTNLLKEVGEKVLISVILEMNWACKLKAKETEHKHFTLADKVVWGHMG